MQVIVAIIITVVVVAFIIYKINNQFGKKEFILLFIVILITGVVANMTLKNQEEKVPNLFKTKYEKEKNCKIVKFSYERLNNKTLSSNSEFIYDFDFIINKENKQFVCSAKNVTIKKIQDEFIFENFKNLNEKCNEN